MTHSKNSTSRQQAKVKSLIVQAIVVLFFVASCGHVFAQSAPRPFAATDSLSFGDRLSHLESSLGLGQSPPDAPILDRIARVEQRVFGQVRQGSILDRLKALEANERNSASQAPQFNPAQQQQFNPAQQQQFNPAQQQQFNPAQQQQFNPAQQQQFNQAPVQGYYPPATTTPAVMPPNSAGGAPASVSSGVVPSFGNLPNPQMAAPIVSTPVPQSLTPQPPQATPSIKPGRLADIIKHAHVASLVTLPDVYPPSFLRVEPSDSERPADRSDYLTSVMTESKNKVLKFEKMPVPVYITPIQEYGFPKAIKEAFADWEARTKGLITFAEVKSPDDARIIIKFSRLGLKSGNDCSLGAHTMTNWKARGAGRLAFLPVGNIPVPLYIPAMGPKYSVPPQVIEVNLDVIYSHEEEFRLLLLKNITAHELGHALGMLGHSPTEGDMMYPITDEHSRLSQRDINTITRLYQRKADIPLQ